MITAVVLLSGAIIWFVPLLMYKHTGTDAAARLKAVTDTRTAMLTGLAGLAAIGGLIFTARNLQINQKTLEATQQSQTETIRLSREAQLTERYTKAIEQLGSEKLDIRLGGLYALERIAVDSERDHASIVEVLSAFVREHSKPPSYDDYWGIKLREDPRQPNTDIQTALTILGRLPSRSEVMRADLSGAHLEGARLVNADLRGARLRGTHLRAADLRDSHLEGADIRGAHFEDAILNDVHFEGAYAVAADFHKTILYGAHFERSEAASVNFEYSNLMHSNFSDADMYDVRLEAAMLGGADLEHAKNLTPAQLQVASLDEGTRLPPELAAQRRLVRDPEYMKAVEQLGSNKLEVRVSGVRSLERIVANSHLHQPTVVATLSAFVRNYRSTLGAEASAHGTAKDSPRAILESGEQHGPTQPTDDLRLAIALLGECASRSGMSPDLREVVLDNMDLRGSRFNRADMSHASLRGSILSDAQLQKVLLRDAHLEDAVLSHVDLTYATLDDARLDRAQLSHARLNNASLSSASFSGADLADAQLDGARAIGARLTRANLSRTSLHNTNLDYADLRGAQGLTKSQLRGALTSEETQLPTDLPE
jgi:uncharacterized protein YjbI with pentapeptide repeats